MHASKHSYVGDPAIAQQIEEHQGDITCPVGQKQRAAEAFRLPGIEWTRQRQAELATSACRGSNGLDSDKRSSPPPDAATERCALITAEGSPTVARSLRI